MVKRGSKSFSANKLADTGLVMADLVRKVMEMEREIGRLRHHVSVLSKREVGLRRELEGKGKGMEGKEEVAGEVAEGMVEEVADEVVAGGVAQAPQEAEEGGAGGSVSGSVGSVAGWSDRMTDLRSRLSDEDVVVGGKIVPLVGYEPGVEVVEVGSSTVVPSAPRAIQELREREVGLGAPAGPRAQLARGRGVGLIRGRGQQGFGPSGSLFGTTGGFYARGPGRGRGGGLGGGYP